MATARALSFTSAVMSGACHSNASTSRRPWAASGRIVRLPTLRLGHPLKSAGGYQQKGCSSRHSSQARRSVAAELADNGDVEPFVAGDDAYALDAGSANSPDKTAASLPLSVLVIGGGGREHALCYALSQASSCARTYCAPGNAGIDLAGAAICVPNLDVADSAAVIAFCREKGVGLVVVGPEAPLVAGLVDDLAAEGIPAFGPSAEAAQLEGSKTFMKSLCDRYNIPTAKYEVFTDPSAAKDYIRQQGVPIVVKADGLAAGKGVVVAFTIAEACAAVDDILVARSFGSAGGSIVIEEFLTGEEVSFFAIVDGRHALALASAQDHKRVGEGDTGPNTGGMGAYSPAPLLTPALEACVMETIIEPTVRGMAADGHPFVGVLYAGLMVDASSQRGGIPSVKLLEYNVRLGDPECQVMMVRLQSDLPRLLLAAVAGRLKEVPRLDWSSDAALVVVMAAQGYPGPYRKGSAIRSLDKAEGSHEGVHVFHAGTARNMAGDVVANGGRVLGVTALGRDVSEAQRRAYAAVDLIDWPEGFCRRDIGWRAVAVEEASRVVQ
eukprot:TRINITY_DN7055_c0_g1_i1.p1 TRINITY_DN7055_c0_g1~~TRINITY_DN7055_c0_g1_i1.p1  ORF type:complete len:633 (-),score=123.76 TRINITY_DN7055_c0_g1_i1:1451-3109(-)